MLIKIIIMKLNKKIAKLVPEHYKLNALVALQQNTCQFPMGQFVCQFVPQATMEKLIFCLIIINA